MEGQGRSSHNDPMQFMPLNFGGNDGNDVSQATGDDPSQQVVMEAGRTAYQTDSLSLPWWWAQSTKPSPNYVDFLAESSTFLPKAPCDKMLESIPSSFSGIRAVGGVSEFQTDVLYSSLGDACGTSESTDFSMDMDAWKVRYLRPPYEELVSTPHQIPTQYHTSRTDDSNWDSYDNVSQVDPRATISAPGFLSQPCGNASKQRASAAERNRRMRIASKINALQELLPESAMGGKVSLDDVIDHIKFLQLQIKDLCKRRLGGEPISGPIIFQEGYGHYFCHSQVLNEPLEEMVGKLLETNPLAATQLLENKGLLLLPLD